MRIIASWRQILLRFRIWWPLRGIWHIRSQSTTKVQGMSYARHVLLALVTSQNWPIPLLSALNAQFGCINIAKKWQRDAIDAGLAVLPMNKRQKQVFVISVIAKEKKGWWSWQSPTKVLTTSLTIFAYWYTIYGEWRKESSRGSMWQPLRTILHAQYVRKEMG